MLAKVLSASVHGIDGYFVEVEVDLAPGLPTFSIGGLPDAAIRESKDRVVAAVRNSGFDFPVRKVTINLSPAHVRKEGTAFDLPMAVGVLAADETIPPAKLAEYLFIGELALDGTVRPVNGTLPIALAARSGHWRGLVFPKANWPEVSVVDGLELIPVSSLSETVAFLKGQGVPSTESLECADEIVPPGPDLSEVRGQAYAKRALEVAAAGAHNVLFVGPPGSGKTMLARRLPGILPPMTFEESMETTRIHSVAGMLKQGAALIGIRPFRSPHHTVSMSALAGGGSYPRPGEVSLAHHGVLFLDEMPEFNRSALEVLRQPLEEGTVHVARASMSVTFPARFMLVAAMNPCPCGFQGHPERRCLCTPPEVLRYRARISGPLLDRIDLHVEVPALKVSELTDEPAAAEVSLAVAQRVTAARELQAGRLRDKGVFCNGQMSSRDVREHCRIDEASRNLLRQAVKRLGLSARSVDRILKVARTIADLESEERINEVHVAEAVGYRALDRVHPV